MQDLPRILRRCVRLESGCLVYLGATNAKGYAQAKVGGRRVQVHRYVFATLIEDLPADTTVDHDCRVTSCCEPSHLRAMTRSENTALGNKHRTKRCHKSSRRP